MAAAEHDITIDRASDFAFTLTIQDSNGDPVDLSSGTAADFDAEVRRAARQRLEATFTTSFLTDGTDGKVIFTLPDTETSKLREGFKYKYDVFWTKTDATRERLLFGVATVRDNITVL